MAGVFADYLEDCSFCWVLWPPAVPHAPFAKKYSKQTNIVCFVNDDFREEKVLPKAAWNGWTHLSIRGKMFYTCICGRKNTSERKTVLKHSSRLHSYRDPNNHFSFLTRQSERFHL